MTASAASDPLLLVHDRVSAYWAESLDACRHALQAEAIAIARACGPNQWRLACAGPGADALVQAFRCWALDPTQQDANLILQPFAHVEGAVLMAWAARATPDTSEALLPVLALALGKECEPAYTSDHSRVMLDALPFSALLLDKTLEIKAANSRARRLLDERAGLWDEHQILTFVEARDTQSLIDCMERARQNGNSARPALTQLCAGARSYPVAVLGAGPYCLVIIVDNEDDMRSIWRGVLDLDAAELHLASVILAGRDPQLLFGAG